jgi:hypothetical protein
VGARAAGGAASPLLLLLRCCESVALQGPARATGSGANAPPRADWQCAAGAPRASIFAAVGGGGEKREEGSLSVMGFGCARGLLAHAAIR